MGDISSVKRKVTIVSAAVFLSCSIVGYDDLTELSDEFDSAETIVDWRRIYETEGWGNNVLEEMNINTARAGKMFIVPYTSSWYAEWRGELTYKEVAGDFVITTEVEPRNRAGTGAPDSIYSLAGIMVRTPLAMTNVSQWNVGLQNYVFLSLGTANEPGRYQFEVKTTVNGQSTLHITEGVPRAQIQVARLGGHLIMLRREEGGAWQVHRRYLRPDMPATLQAGLTVYTDWSICEQVGFRFHNEHVLTNGTVLPDGGMLSGCQPDLAASFDYVRYQRPNVPSGLVGAEFSNVQVVSDAQLLSFLGDNANRPGGAVRAPSVEMLVDAGVFSVNVTTETNRSYRVQSSGDLQNWETLTNFVSTSGSFTMNVALAELIFFRAVTP